MSRRRAFSNTPEGASGTARKAPSGAVSAAPSRCTARAPQREDAEKARPTGPELAAEIEAWMARTGCSASRFGEVALRSSTALERIRTARLPLTRTVRRVRDFLAAHPDGVANPKPVLTTAGRIERGQAQAAARRAELEAMRQGAALTPGERMQRAWMAEPSDLVRHLKAVWPDLWDEVIAAAKSEGVSPIEHLVDCVRRGVAG